MTLRWLITLLSVSVLAIPLVACGGSSPSSSDPAAKADQTSQADGAEQADVAEPGDDAAAEPEAGGRVADARDEQPRAAPPRAVGPREATRTVGAGVRGDVGLFYDALARQGSWVRHPDYSYVWIPHRMGAGWRPYQEGRWIWTDEYGWYWDSDEPFAWAVYHYGRWDYDPDYGWFWVPGDTWAPAWVTWRYGGNSIGWAPIAPDARGFASGMPRRAAAPILESWVFVDQRNFAAPDLPRYVVPVSRIRASLDLAVDARGPRFDNGRVYNGVIGRDEIKRFAKGPIETRSLVYVGNRDDAFEDVSGGRVGIYRPVIAPGEMRRPPAAVIEVGRTDRVVIREYADVGGARGRDAPSAALLDVLDPHDRQALIEVRITAKEDALDSRIRQLQTERAALLEQRRKEAKRLEGQLEKEREQALLERLQAQELVRKQKQELATEIKVDAPAADSPVQAPGSPAQAPGESNAAKAPAPTASTAPAEPAKPEPEAAKTGTPAPAAPVANGDAEKGHGVKKGQPPAKTEAVNTPAAGAVPEEKAPAKAKTGETAAETPATEAPAAKAGPEKRHGKLPEEKAQTPEGAVGDTTPVNQTGKAKVKQADVPPPAAVEPLVAEPPAAPQGAAPSPAGGAAETNGAKATSHGAADVEGGAKVKKGHKPVPATEEGKAEAVPQETPQPQSAPAAEVPAQPPEAALPPAQPPQAVIPPAAREVEGEASPTAKGPDAKSNGHGGEHEKKKAKAAPPAEPAGTRPAASPNEGAATDNAPAAAKAAPCEPGTEGCQAAE